MAIPRLGPSAERDVVMDRRFERNGGTTRHVIRECVGRHARAWVSHRWSPRAASGKNRSLKTVRRERPHYRSAANGRCFWSLVKPVTTPLPLSEPRSASEAAWRVSHWAARHRSETKPSADPASAMCGRLRVGKGFLNDIARAGRSGAVNLTKAGRSWTSELSGSSSSGHGPPRVHRVTAELAHCLASDQMTLDIEGVVDGGVGGEKPLRRS